MSNPADIHPKEIVPIPETAHGSGLGGLSGSGFLKSSTTTLVMRNSDNHFLHCGYGGDKDTWVEHPYDGTFHLYGEAERAAAELTGCSPIPVSVAMSFYIPNALITESSPKKDPQ